MGAMAIQVEKLGKRFTRGPYVHGLHGLFEDVARRIVPGLPPRSARKQDPLWALRDVSFALRHGELVGLVGPNGAGKSVLLKILSRITWPTEGHAILEGRVVSMLEVGGGFHPEFTGRENTFLFGSTLGMTIPEVREKFDAIVAFAEVEEFLDTPVKRYSSGTYMRLAFSVAAHLDAKIMLFDELISVGDSDFRVKCLQKIRKMCDEGRTVIFVSHNLDTIRGFCPRTLVLERGHLRFDGPTDRALAQYGAPSPDAAALGL